MGWGMCSQHGVHDNSCAAEIYVITVMYRVCTMVTNKLSLNFNKTKYNIMQFHKAPKPVPYLHLQSNNNEISCVDTFNLLGLKMNDNLK